LVPTVAAKAPYVNAGPWRALSGVIPSRHGDVRHHGGAAGPGPGSAKVFYAEKVGLQALETDLLFTQAVIHVTDVRAAVEEMRRRRVEFEEYDTPETRTDNSIAQMRGGDEAAWFKDAEGNLVGVVPS
jgi:hypothetical protein